MTSTIRFCLVLHNHQPIGNFDQVFEQAYRDSYLPFLDLFEPYSDLKISLHTSGPLMEWLAEHQPEYLERLAALVQDGRVEILGGAFYEPILPMLPPRDRVGQVVGYRRWLEDRIGGKVSGMWMPERVWEQSLASDLAQAGVRYTVLDDFHFRNAGVSDEDLHGYYVTEDNGHLLSVFPGSERLRYLIPFSPPHETIDYLGQLAAARPESVAVFGDDGEKFGCWPETHKHVYEDGWLRTFFDLLAQNKDWINTTTLSEAVESVPPTGKIYLPDGSYREMTEWALPVKQQHEYEEVVSEMRDDGRWERIKKFIRGGFWRNFKVKYPETNEMYARMMMVSRRFQKAEEDGAAGEALQMARRELYRGQCNCSYWHGAFGGVYLPHLRNAVYKHLIAADNLLDELAGRTEPYAEAQAGDYNFDARQEIRLTNDKLVCLIAPATGGRIYELDVRSICHNLSATLTRRPESYHRRVLAGSAGNGYSVAAIHDEVKCKQEGLDQCLQYDAYERKSLVDHFYDNEASLEAVRSGEAPERGDFVEGVYETRLRRNPDRVQVQLTRDGVVGDSPVRITKGVTIQSGADSMEIAYLLEGLPQRPVHFAVEFNFAGLPPGADDRHFHRQDGSWLGRLETRLDLQNETELGLIDKWLGVDVRLASNRPTNFWTFPVESVSQSEGGFELVHQSVAVLPHWLVTADPDGRWSVVLTLTADTALADSRKETSELAATVS